MLRTLQAAEIGGIRALLVHAKDEAARAFCERLSVLETSYLVHRLPAWHANLRKQVVKAPKLHFFDSGLVCYLLGIRDPEQLRLHPLRGAIFESGVVSEAYKALVHRGARPSLFHFRETRGSEIDLLVEYAGRWEAVEVTSGATVTPDFFKGLQRLPERLGRDRDGRSVRAHVVYGGDEAQERSTARVVSWRDAPALFAAMV